MLRAGIVCVGFKLSASEVAAAGLFSVPAVMASVGAGLVLIPKMASAAGLAPRLARDGRDTARAKGGRDIMCV